MPRVDPNAHVKGFLATMFDHVFVGNDAGSLKCFTGDLLTLAGNQMSTKRKDGMV
jgi:hypothetical protein